MEIGDLAHEGAEGFGGTALSEKYSAVMHPSENEENAAFFTHKAAVIVCDLLGFLELLPGRVSNHIDLRFVGNGGI